MKKVKSRNKLVSVSLIYLSFTLLIGSASCNNKRRNIDSLTNNDTSRHTLNNEVQFIEIISCNEDTINIELESSNLKRQATLKTDSIIAIISQKVVTDLSNTEREMLRGMKEEISFLNLNFEKFFQTRSNILGLSFDALSTHSEGKHYSNCFYIFQLKEYCKYLDFILDNINENY